MVTTNYLVMPILNSVANIESSFEFIVDEKVVLSEQNWNLVEFTQQLVKWNKNGLKDDFRYYCMDTDEEDIFIFQQVNNKYRFRSVWAEGDLERLLQHKEIMNFIESIRTVAIERVLNELQVDLRKIVKLELK